MLQLILRVGEVNNKFIREQTRTQPPLCTPTNSKKNTTTTKHQMGNHLEDEIELIIGILVIE